MIPKALCLSFVQNGSLVTTLPNLSAFPIDLAPKFLLSYFVLGLSPREVQARQYLTNPFHFLKP